MFKYLQDQNNRKYSNEQLNGRRFTDILQKNYDRAIEFYEMNKICIKDKT